MKDREVTAFVYRTDKEGLYDWTRVLAPFLDAHKSTARQGPRLGLSAQLKIDFLAKAVLEGHVYSVPLLDAHSTDDMLGRAPLQDADEALYTAMDGIVFFTFVESHLRRKKRSHHGNRKGTETHVGAIVRSVLSWRANRRRSLASESHGPPICD